MRIVVFFTRGYFNRVHNFEFVSQDVEAANRIVRVSASVKTDQANRVEYAEVESRHSQGPYKNYANLRGSGDEQRTCV